eukprot:gnl/MRDRNA2_/MRDRNA2_27260_c0_seq1.p1 gnl/MRDRNA2_/MRDRNA2_27260_c0~~gnl/MRDRNA2_/MRDRNA2_27260_c0_seq1.p1  ORF type:complete len:694 (+),score=154.74 gnl/MRDRNA2_/MRDRNA2_27260_c0_seq1:103-2184(+)
MANVRKIVFSDLPPAERERFYQFLVDHKVQFLQDPNGSGSMVATVRVTPPEGSGKSAASVFKQSSQGPEAGDAVKKTGVPVNVHVVAPQLLVRRYGRFCAALLPPAAVPNLRRLGQLLHFLDEVYDARFTRDAARVRNQQGEASAIDPNMSFPDFVVDFASKKYGLRKLVNQSCWDLAESVDQLRGENLAVELFGRFLDESYDVSDLLFFLFARSVVRREVTIHVPRGKQAMGTRRVPFELDARQCVSITRIILGGEQPDLQDTVLRRLDAEMLRLRASGPEPVLDVNTFLGISTAEYHKMRGGSDVGPLPEGGEPVPGESQGSEGPIGALGFGAAPRQVEHSLQGYDADAQEQVDKMARHLMVSLDGHGQAQGVDQRHIYEWATQIVKRRFELRNQAAGTRFDTLQNVMGELQSGNMPTLLPHEAGYDSLSTSGGAGEIPRDIAALGGEEFERDMEAGIRRILQRSVEDLSGRVIASTAPPGSLDATATGKYRTALAKEIAPLADLLLEALVAQDLNLWIEQLQLEDLPENVRELHIKRFNSLQSQLQAALAQDGGVHAVWRLTEQLVCTEVFVDMVNSTAAEILTSVAGMRIEKPLRATQVSGVPSSNFRQGHGKSPLGQPAPRVSGGATPLVSARTVDSSPTDDLGFDDQDGADDLGFEETPRDMGPSSAGPALSRQAANNQEEDFGESF